MLGTDNKDKLSAMKKRVEQALANPHVPSPLTDALRDVLAAINYQDDILLDSSVNALLVGLATVAMDIVRVELARSEATKNAIQKAWQEVVDGQACEDFDGLKDIFEGFIDENIAKMTGIQNDIVIALEKVEHPVENAQGLEEGIRSMRKFRENILKDWPSSGKRPSPINREAIAEARKAIAAGHRGLSKEQLVWGNDASKKGNE